MKKGISEKILYRIRKSFLSWEYFHGTFADNYKDMQKFAANRNILIQHYHFDSLNPKVVIPYGEKNADVIRELVSAQMKIHNRELRKQKRSILYFVDDNLITRALGYKETIDHYRLVGFPVTHTFLKLER